MNDLFKDDNDKFLNIKESLIEKSNINKVIKKLHKSRKKIEQNTILSDESNFTDNKNSGLYFFEIKQKSDKEIDDTWNTLNVKWGGIKYTPKIIKKRWTNLEFNNNDYFPFYVGKSNCLQKRVNEHIFAMTKNKEYLKSTSALRLREHFKDEGTKEIMNKFEFFVSYVEIKIESELLSLLESEIRNELKCMVGKDG